MKYQALSIEYVLLILIGLFVSYVSIDWLNNHKSDFLATIGFYKKQHLENMLSEILYSTKYFYNASISYKIPYYISCSNKVLVIDTGNTCDPKFSSEPYIGDYLLINNTVVKVYSNKSSGYYSGVIIGYRFARVCYESKDSYIILSDGCNITPCENCDIRIEKIEGNLYIK